MNVQALRLEAGEAVCDGLEPFPHCVEMSESFLQAEVAQIVGAKLVAEEPGELLILFWPEAKTNRRPYQMTR